MFNLKIFSIIFTFFVILILSGAVQIDPNGSEKLLVNLRRKFQNKIFIINHSNLNKNRLKRDINLPINNLISDLNNLNENKINVGDLIHDENDGFLLINEKHSQHNKHKRDLSKSGLNSNNSLIIVYDGAEFNEMDFIDLILKSENLMLANNSLIANETVKPLKDVFLELKEKKDVVLFHKLELKKPEDINQVVDVLDKVYKDLQNDTVPDEKIVVDLDVLNKNNIVVIQNNRELPQVGIEEIKVEALEGTRTEISCKIASLHDAEIKWVDSKGNELSKTENQNFYIQNHVFPTIDLYEEGTYFCVGTNKFGSANKSMEITVKSSGHNITILNKEVDIVEKNSKDVQYKCETVKKNLRKFWFFNGKPIDRYSPDYKITNTDDLIIRKPTRRLNGAYACAATFNGHTKNDTVELKVKFEPTFRNKVTPEFIVVKLNTPYEHECDLDGVPEPNITWKVVRGEKGAIKETIEGKTLKFNMTADREGSYICSGENPFGKSSPKTFIFDSIADKPPKLYKEYENKTIYINRGDSIKVGCICEDCHPARFLWTVYNSNSSNNSIPNSELKRKEILTDEFINNGTNKRSTYKIEIENLQRNLYLNCVAENDNGRDDLGISIEVLEVFKEPPKGKSPTKTAYTKCTAKSAKLALYHKDGALLAKDSSEPNLNGRLYECQEYTYEKDKLKTTVKHILSIVNSTEIKKNADNDAKKLTKCTLKNVDKDFKFPFNSSIHLCNDGKKDIAILESEDFKYPLQGSVTVEDKNKLSINCSFIPYKDPVKTSYECDKINGIGIDQDEFFILPIEPPFITSKFNESYEILPGVQFSEKCVAEGNPPPKVYWTRNDEVFVKNNKTPNALEITPNDVNLSGNYSCNAENIHGNKSIKMEIRVYQKPTIVNHTTNTIEIGVPNGLLDRTKFLVCPIIGCEEHEYTWETAIEHEKHQKSLQLSIEGNRTCTCTNPAGTESFIFQIISEKPPKSLVIEVDDPSSNITEVDDGHVFYLEAGKPLTLKCNAEGRPKPKTSWFFNGNLIKSDDLLEFNETRLQDAGFYICRAENSIGSLQKSVIFMIESKPVFMDETPPPSPFYGDVNGQLLLNCSSFAEPKAAVSWFFNNENLYISDSIYEKDYVQLIDSGKYTCIVANKLGSIRREFNVDIKLPTAITSISGNIEVNKNEPITLDCVAIGKPPPILTWSSNDKNIISTNVEMTPELEAMLKSNKPVYVTHANNVTTATINPKDVQDVDHYGLFYHRKYDQFTTEVGLKLFMTKPTVEESGPYQCGTNTDTGPVIKTVMVAIHSAPYIREEFKSNTQEVGVIENFEETFECPIEGNPTPRYHWNLNDENIDFYDENYEEEEFGKKLKVKQMPTVENATLTCYGENDFGSETFNYKISLKQLPRFVDSYGNLDPIKRMNVQINKGGTIELSCENTGFPKPTVSWVMFNKNITIMLPDTENVLIMSEIPNTAIFACEVSNPLGMIKRDFFVNVLAPPEIIGDEDNTFAFNKGSQIYLECEMTGEPKPTIEWFKEEYNGYQRLSPNFHINIEPNNLHIDTPVERDVGKYLCRGQNVAGAAEKRFNVLIDLPQWSTWSDWSECSVSCERGYQSRTRMCTNLNGTELVGQCDGESEEVRECVSGPCPQDGGWGPWSDFSPCSQTCHDMERRIYATKTRVRECNNPPPAYGGKRCPSHEPSVDSQTCDDVYPCPINPIAYTAPPPRPYPSHIPNPIPNPNIYTPPFQQRPRIPSRRDCRDGYRMNFLTGKCVDINECIENNVCDHDCINTEGSFRCSCRAGYTLYEGTACTRTSQPGKRIRNVEVQEDENEENFFSKIMPFKF